MRQGGRYSKKTSGGSSMKKIISLLVTALMIFPMTGCAKKNASGEEEKVLPVKVMGAHEEENPILLQYLGNTNSKDNIKDRKSTRLNSSHANISYAVFCLKKNYTRSPLLTPT